MTFDSLRASIMVPGFAAMASAAAGGKSCHGNTCDPIKEYCDTFSESCKSCGADGGICDVDSHNYDPDKCTRECSAFLVSEIKAVYNQQNAMHNQQNLMLIVLIVVIVLIILQYAWQCCRWLSRKRCFPQLLKKLHLRKQHTLNAKDINGQNATTIQNVMAIHDIERAPSQIYSVTGAEGSVMTMTTPVSTRYPAEDTTPTNAPTEYSYDNQALAITPVSEKPTSNRAF